LIATTNRERSQARALALQALCAFDSLGDGFLQQLDTFLRDTVNYVDLGWNPPPGPGLLPLARRLATGAWHFRNRADELLTQHVADWSVSRMPPVDRNILRLGLYELLEEPETPHQIVLNDAVELSKQFGGAETPAFVNGVLDGLRRKLDAEMRENV
jgi:transcription antitermination protein NusB